MQLQTAPSVTGNTMEQMRTDLEEVVRRLSDAGDHNLRYVDGLRVFHHEEIAQYTTDQCHPDGDGMFVMANNFDNAVMQSWITPVPSTSAGGGGGGAIKLTMKL